MGVSTALIQLKGGHFGDTLFILGVVTPVVAVASFVVGALVAAALDLWILKVRRSEMGAGVQTSVSGGRRLPRSALR